jgi:hypothetical protein
LRHSFASIGAGASLGLPIIGKLLGHTQAATTHRYAHLDADPMRRAAEAIGATIAAAMDGKKGAGAFRYFSETTQRIWAASARAVIQAMTLPLYSPAGANLRDRDFKINGIVPPASQACLGPID